MCCIVKLYDIILLERVRSAFDNNAFNLDGKFDLSVGVLQGDTLSPFLFIVVIYFILRKSMVEECGVKLVIRMVVDVQLHNSRILILQIILHYLHLLLQMLRNSF
jgi:hypothetical protein